MVYLPPRGICYVINNKLPNRAESELNVMFTPTNITMIDINSITVETNPRLRKNLQIDVLSENIEAVGLTDPMHIWFPGEGTVPEMLRGHRRLEAILALQERNPERFNELFGEGAPCIVYEGIEKIEALLLKLDHSGQVSLSDPYELIMSSNLLFGEGNLSEAQVSNHLKPLIMRISPPGGSVTSDIKKLEEKLAEAVELGDTNAQAVINKEIDDRFAKGLRGKVQHLRNIYRCPEMVNATFEYKATGVKPKGYDEKALPTLTTDQTKVLWKAHEIDLKVMDEEKGVPKYNKVIVGPMFKEAWKAILEKAAEKEAGKTPPAPKAMSSKDMKAQLTKWTSDGFYKLTKRHSGDKSVEGLDALDVAYKAMDIVREYDKDLYETVIAEAAKLQAELADANELADVEG